MHKTQIEGVIISLPSDYKCQRFANVENVTDIAIFNHISSVSYPSSNMKPWLVGKYKTSIQAENGYRCMYSINEVRHGWSILSLSFTWLSHW